MNSRMLFSGIILGVLAAPSMSYADADTGRSHPEALVGDSTITMKIKSKLAAEHFSSLTKINVDTDMYGVIWLTGISATAADSDRAAAIARAMDGVIYVKNEISIKAAK